MTALAQATACLLSVVFYYIPIYLEARDVSRVGYCVWRLECCTQPVRRGSDCETSPAAPRPLHSEQLGFRAGRTPLTATARASPWLIALGDKAR